MESIVIAISIGVGMVALVVYMYWFYIRNANENIYQDNTEALEMESFSGQVDMDGPRE